MCNCRALNCLRNRPLRPGYGFAILADNGNRRAEWTKREAQGEQSLYYSAQLVESDSDGASSADQPAGEAHPADWEEAQELAAQRGTRPGAGEIQLRPEHDAGIDQSAQ